MYEKRPVRPADIVQHRPRQRERDQIGLGPGTAAMEGQVSGASSGPGRGLHLRSLTSTYHPQLGPKFIERIYRDMEPMFFRDIRQGTDWLSQGKYAVLLHVSKNRPGGLASCLVAESDPLPIEETRHRHRLGSLGVDEPASSSQWGKSLSTGISPWKDKPFSS